MIGIRTLVALVAVAAATACTGLRSGEQPDPAADLEVGLEALEVGDFAGAYEVLYPLYRRHWDLPIGQRALLALTAAEIDPRNENRRLWSSADMASHYLQIPEAPAWTVPVARSLYLLALELGAAEERIARAEAERDRAQAQADQARTAPGGAARTLPSLPGRTVPQQLRAVETEREELRRRLQETQQLLTQRERQLRESEQELERIRRTIRG